VHTERHAMFMPHRLEASLLMSYTDDSEADAAESAMRATLGRAGPKWEMNMVADRPPMGDRQINAALIEELSAAAAKWEIPLELQFATSPSVAGLVSGDVAAVCGMGPVTTARGTPNEAVQRISLVQRTLLLAEYLLGRATP